MGEDFPLQSTATIGLPKIFNFWEKGALALKTILGNFDKWSENGRRFLSTEHYHNRAPKNF